MRKYHRMQYQYMLKNSWPTFKGGMHKEMTQELKILTMKKIRHVLYFYSVAVNH